MPTYPHIESYHSALEELIEFGGSDSELSIRAAFQNCLIAYCREHRERLALVPELRAANNVVPDGTVKDTLRMARGYWEAKDSHDDLDAEIERKFNRGYPRDPTIRERFNAYRFADYKERVIELLGRARAVSVKTMDVVDDMAYWDDEGKLVVFGDRDKHEWSMMGLAHWFSEPEDDEWLAELEK